MSQFVPLVNAIIRACSKPNSLELVRSYDERRCQPATALVLILPILRSAMSSNRNNQAARSG
jgi:hypothetical protein